LDYLYEFSHLLSALRSDVLKCFYIDAHLHSRTYTAAVEYSSNLSAIYTKSCAQTFPPIFGLFEIFDRNFAKLVAPTSNKNENYVVHLNGLSILKRLKPRRNRPINGNAMLVRTSLCTSRTNTAPASDRDKTITKKTYKHHVFAPTAGARCTIFTKLCTVIELVVPIKKLSFIF